MIWSSQTLLDGLESPQVTCPCNQAMHVISRHHVASIVGMWGREYHVFTPLKVMVHTISAPPVAPFQVDPLATSSGIPSQTRASIRDWAYRGPLSRTWASIHGTRSAVASTYRRNSVRSRPRAQSVRHHGWMAENMRSSTL